jgi:ribosomal protein L31E
LKDPGVKILYDLTEKIWWRSCSSPVRGLGVKVVKMPCIRGACTKALVECLSRRFSGRNFGKILEKALL